MIRGDILVRTQSSRRFPSDRVAEDLYARIEAPIRFILETVKLEDLLQRLVWKISDGGYESLKLQKAILALASKLIQSSFLLFEHRQFRL